MPITTMPTKTAGDLGPVLTNVRTPVANEFSAVNLDRIKDRIIELFNEVGLSDGSTPGSLREAINAISNVVQIPIENGETITAGQAVAASTVSGRCRRANAVGNAAGSFLGVCTVGGTGNGAGTVLASVVTFGKVTVSGLVANTPVYLSSSTPGLITSTVPTGSGNLRLRIGFAYSTTEFIIHVGEPYIL